MAGFHQSRYFHEATELNPLVGKRVPWEELKALCDTKEVSYCDYNPPHPYMMEPLANTREADISGQQNSGLKDILKPVDPQKPEWPDVPKQVAEDGEEGETPESPDLGHEKGRKGSAKIANFGVQNWATPEYFEGKTE